MKNKQGFMSAIKQGIISQLYKDGLLTETIYRKLMLSIGLPLEKPVEKTAGITKKH